MEFGSDVTNIKSDIFYACTNLTSIMIPDSVTSIGSYAFEDCSGLTSVTIPGGVTSIGYAAFRGCSSLMSVTIGNGEMSIGDGAFGGCSGLTSVTIPDSVTSIGYEAFNGCNGLTSVTITANGGDAASVKQAMIDAINNTEISDNITWNMPDSPTPKYNVSIALKDGSTENWLVDNESIDRQWTIDHGYLKSIGGQWLKDIQEIYIDDGVTSIGEHAFEYCTTLEKVTIKSTTLSSIGTNAF